LITIASIISKASLLRFCSSHSRSDFEPVLASARHTKMPLIQDTTPSLPTEPEDALFLSQLESSMRDEFVGDVRAADFLDELEAMMKYEFFADLPADIEANEDHVVVDAASDDSLYKPLAGEDQIRLLCLEPGEAGELKGKLLHVHLNGNPAYEALSYAWGPPVMPYSITLPNGILRITKSLFTSLIRLRRRGKRRLLWIDQLCINQKDTREKNRQILLMRQIYSSASRVLVWLGEDDGNGRIALRLLEEIGKADTLSLPTKSVSAAWVRANNLPASGDRTWFALLAFWRRPWFRRAWVVQEFVLARDAVMICGDAKLGWKSFTRAYEKMIQYSLLAWGTYDNWYIPAQKAEAISGSISFTVMMETKYSLKTNSMTANVIRSFSERDASALEEFTVSRWSKVPGLKELVMILRENPEATGPITQMYEQLVEANHPDSFNFRHSMCDLLMLFSKSEALDARDRLFAFLGLATDGGDISLRPDYEEPVGSVFLRYAKHFVRHGDGMKLLYQASGVSNREISIPSWVPNWTQPAFFDHNPINMVARYNLSYKAAANTSLQIRLADEEGEIVISGGYVDKVSRTAVNYLGKPDLNDSSDWLLKIRNFFKEADSFFLGRESYVTGEPLFDVQWKTLIGNSSGEVTLTVPKDYGQQYRVSRQMLEGLGVGGSFPSLEGTNSYFKRLFITMMCYKLCETQAGLVGMVPLDTMVGDSVYIFTGGTLPFILRSSAGLLSKYQVVGGCYIHGIMNGEVVRSEKWKVEDVTLQ
jgi:hypothetical protein